MDKCSRTISCDVRAHLPRVVPESQVRRNAETIFSQASAWVYGLCYQCLGKGEMVTCSERAAGWASREGRMGHVREAGRSRWGSGLVGAGTQGEELAFEVTESLWLLLVTPTLL